MTQKLPKEFPDVSRETLCRLEIYHAELLKWNERINLIGPSEDTHIWRRHFADSLQLIPLLADKARVGVDIGSGAGFPGLVLAIATPLKMHLIESDRRKCAFLRHIMQLLGLDIEIHAARCEEVLPFQADIVVSRACAALKELLHLAKPFCMPETICFFPKGRSYSSELKDASKRWQFDLSVHPSITDSSGAVLELRNIAPL